MLDKNRKWWEYMTIVVDVIPPFDIPKDYAKSEVAFCKNIGAESLLIFVEKDWEGQYIFPSAYGPIYPPLKKRDLLRELVTECKEKGLRFVAAFAGMHSQKALIKKHPAWASRSFTQATDPNFNPRSCSMACINSGYREVLQGMVREVIADYGVDAIYFDFIAYPSTFCFCPGCQNKYEEIFGKQMPLKLRDDNRLKLGEDTVVTWSKQIRDIINQTNPEVCYALDCHGTIIGHCDAGERIHTTFEYVDARVLECSPEIIREQPYYAEIENRALVVETGKTVWWAKWIARNADSNKTSNPPASLRLWGASAIAAKSPLCFVCQRTEQFDTQSLKPMKELAAIAKKARPHLLEAETVAPIGLFHSLESRLQRLPVRVREHRKYFEGWYLALKGEHIPFDVIGEGDLRSDKMNKYSAVILPNTRYMSDKTVEEVRGFVTGGGALIASGYSSLSDEQGRDRKDFALSDIFRAQYAFEADGMRNGKPIRAPYYKAFAHHPISKGLEDTYWSFPGDATFPGVTLARGATAIFKTVGYDLKCRPTGGAEYLESYAKGKAAEVVLTASEKPFRAVYIPGPLDGAYWEYGWPELAEIMRNTVRWAVKNRIPLETDAEENVWLVLHGNERKRSWVLHLQNHGVNNQHAIGFNCGLSWDTPEPVSHAHPVRTCFRTAPLSWWGATPASRRCGCHTPRTSASGRRCLQAPARGRLDPPPLVLCCPTTPC